MLFHVVLDDLQLLFPDIGAQGQSAVVASVIGDIARFQIEQQPRKSRHRPGREGDHLAVRDGAVFQVDRVPGAVVQPIHVCPKHLRKGLDSLLPSKVVMERISPSSSQGRVRAVLPAAALHHSPRAAAHTESSTVHAMMLFLNVVPPKS